MTRQPRIQLSLTVDACEVVPCLEMGVIRMTTGHVRVLVCDSHARALQNQGWRRE